MGHATRESGTVQDDVYREEMFALRYTIHEYRADFEVHRIAGLIEDKPVFADERHSDGMKAFDNPSYAPIDGAHFLYGTLKWDGCCDIQQTNEDCMMHFCDFDRPVPMLIKVVSAIRALGPKIPAWDHD